MEEEESTTVGGGVTSLSNSQVEGNEANSLGAIPEEAYEVGTEVGEFVVELSLMELFPHLSLSL